MTIQEKLSAVKEFQDYAAKYQQMHGTEVTLNDWAIDLNQAAMRSALTEISTVATGMLADGFAREYAERILAEVEATA